MRAARRQDQGGRARGHAKIVRVRREDAYFIARRNQTANEEGAPREWIAFGVADGVYMWRNLGIDAGLFSRRLMGVASDHFARDAPDPSAPPPGPLRVA